MNLDISENNKNFVFEKIYNIFYLGISSSVPRRFHRENQFPSWYDHELIFLIFNKKQMHFYWKIFKNEKDKKDYERLRAICKSKTRSLYTKYLNNVQNCIKSNIKFYWSYVNKLRTNKSIPNKMSLANEESLTDLETANLFAKFFSSVHGVSNLNSCNFFFSLFNNNETWTFTEREVAAAVNRVNSSSSFVPDILPIVVIKKCISFFAPILTKLFNICIANAFYPAIWKTNFVTPVFKTGDRLDITNYRPISILSPVASIFDSLITTRLKSCINAQITMHQHGFMPGRSTETSLALYNDLISKVLAGN